MKLVIFDLDLTLVDTSKCTAYLKTKTGREVIVGMIENDDVVTSLYDPDTPKYINELIDNFNDSKSDMLPIIVSNSPENYCIAVLKKHGFKFLKEVIFGNAGKPAVDFDSIKNDIEYLGYDDKGVEECIVIGDNPKDIHFAHEIHSPSIWASWGYDKFKHEFAFKWCKPTKTAKDLDGLKKYIACFKRAGVEQFNYARPNFLIEWGMVTIDSDSYSNHTIKEDIGFADYYNPEGYNSSDSHEQSAFFCLKRTVKESRNVQKDELNSQIPQRFFNSNKKFSEAMVLKKLAGIFENKFTSWLDEIGISGKVLLVAVPSSFPAECYNTFSMNLIAEWWSEWNKKPTLELIYTDLFVERFRPKQPSHKQLGYRFINEQLSTLGVVKDRIDTLQNDLSAVIFLDDVTTSGSTFNAMATLFRELKVVNDDIPLLGYALYKTQRTGSII